MVYPGIRTSLGYRRRRGARRSRGGGAAAALAALRRTAQAPRARRGRRARADVDGGGDKGRWRRHRQAAAGGAPRPGRRRGGECWEATESAASRMGYPSSTPPSLLPHAKPHRRPNKPLTLIHPHPSYSTAQPHQPQPNGQATIAINQQTNQDDCLSQLALRW